MDFFRLISSLFLVTTSFGSRIPGLDDLLPSPGDVCTTSDQLPTFLRHLAPEQASVERLVIFVYRKIGSDDLISFIPSAEHQKCIQNYPETPGDEIFRLNSTTVESLFQNSEDKLIQIELEQNIAENNSVVADDAWKLIFNDCTSCLPINNQNLVNSSDSDQHNINIISPLPLLPPPAPPVPGEEISDTTDNVNYDDYIKFIIDGSASNSDGLNLDEEEEDRDEKHNSSSIPIPQDNIVSQSETHDSGQNDTEIPIKFPNQWQEVVSEGSLSVPKEVNEPVKITFHSQDISIDNNTSPQQSTKITPHVVIPSEQQQKWNYEGYEEIPKPISGDQIPEKHVIRPGLLEDMAIQQTTDHVYQTPEKYVVHPGLQDSGVVYQPIKHVFTPGSHEKNIINGPPNHVDQTPKKYVISPGSHESFIINRPTNHVDQRPKKYVISSGSHESFSINRPPNHVDQTPKKYVISSGSHKNMIIHQPTNPGKYVISPGLHDSVIIHHPSAISQQFPVRQNPSNLFSHWQFVHVPDTNPPKDQFNSYAWTLTVPKLNKAMKLPIAAREVGGPTPPGYTFDSWLMAQLNIINSDGQVMPSNAADMSFVRNKIEEALQYHGYTVTKDGHLVDKYGVTSSLSNLKLRPLLIGKSFEYNLLTDHEDGKYKRPVTPLMEGLLLSLIKPARILGLVTLGLTWPGDVYFDENNRVHIQRKEWRVPKVESVRGNFATGSGEAKKQPGVLGESLLKLLIPKVVARIEGLQGGIGGDVTVSTTDITPGFRIIGGSSAMGTGVPLTSKGRSGLEE